MYSISHFTLSISNDLSRKKFIKLNKGAGRVIKTSDPFTAFALKSVFQVLLRMALATRQSQLLHGDNVRLVRTVDTVVDESNRQDLRLSESELWAAVPAGSTWPQRDCDGAGEDPRCQSGEAADVYNRVM